MHLKRWITSIVVLPFVIFLIFKGAAFFAVFIGIVCVLTLCEYFRIVFNPYGKTISGIILLSGLCVSLLMVWAAYKNHAEMILFLLSLNLLAGGLFSLTQFKSDSYILENLSRQIQGMTYIPLSLCFLVLIRNSPDGMAWIFMLICVIFAGDTGAYYVGSYWGKHKLCPSVSPGKTIEGSLGGLLANAGVGMLFKILFLPALSLGTSLLCFLLLGVAGQIGDLFESEFKRKSGIKDSGFILPGHGGMLDRIDALLFAAPVAYFFKIYIF